MNYRIQGKSVFINAGAHGIGEATADLLTQERACVVVAGRDGDALREKAHRWAGIVVVDLATAEGIQQATSHVLATFGRAPDILINNLGVGNSASLEHLSDETWAQSFQINLMECVPSCPALIRRMAELGSAAAVNMGSDINKQPEPTMIDYGPCNAGLLYLTKALAIQYAPRVRVNAVLPGPIWTNMWTRPGGSSTIL
jgi:NAD(P)-dependent dehydrogenase (short-subunit alcohol dehydrogenase family)